MINYEVAQEIADKTTEIIGYNVLITDDAGIVIGSGDKNRVGTFHEASVETIRQEVMTWHDVAAAEQLEGVKPGVTVPVVLENRTVGTVGITGKPDEVKRFGMVVKSQTEIMLRESLHLRIALLQEKALESLLQDIANYDPTIVEPAVLVARGEELGYDLNLSRVAVVVDLARFADLANSFKSHGNSGRPELELQSLKVGVLRTIKEVFSGDQDLATSVGTGKYGLLHDVWSAESSAAALHQTQIQCHSLAEIIKTRHEIDVNIGIGVLARSIPELRMSYHDAWGALQLGKRLARDRQIFQASEFRVQELLLTASYSSSKGFLQALLQPIKEQDDWEDLRLTILTWCESGYNVASASRTLHIHKNTLLYRLNKIEKIDGQSLKDYKHAFAVYLACLLDELDI
jgi:carbohydrate diacid regulator